MKIQIDTIARTIKLDEAVLLSDLIQTLDGMFPDKMWMGFKLITNMVISWRQSPIIIDRPYPWVQPYTYPWITYETVGVPTYRLNSGIYDVKIQ